MLDLLELIFGTADSLDSLFTDKGKKTDKHKIPIWLRILFFILIYGSALLTGISGGFMYLKESHMVRAIAYWTFSLCLVILLVFIIYKIIKSHNAKK